MIDAAASLAVLLGGLAIVYADLKRLLEERFRVGHSTLEFEFPGEQLDASQHVGRVVPH